MLLKLVWTDSNYFESLKFLKIEAQRPTFSYSLVQKKIKNSWGHSDFSCGINKLINADFKCRDKMKTEKVLRSDFLSLEY